MTATPTPPSDAHAASNEALAQAVREAQRRSERGVLGHFQAGNLLESIVVRARELDAQRPIAGAPKAEGGLSSEAITRIARTMASRAMSQRNHFEFMADSLTNSYNERDAGMRKAYDEAGRAFGELAYQIADQFHIPEREIITRELPVHADYANVCDYVGPLLDAWEIQTDGELQEEIRQGELGKKLDALRDYMEDPEPREDTRELPAAELGEPDTSQNWAGMDGDIAFHLIERHADDWNDAHRMMDAWRLANPPAPACGGGETK